MLELIRDLYGHQSWADAQMWNFLDGAPTAQADRKVVELLNHIHAVQRFFLSSTTAQPLTVEELQQELPLPELRESYARYHASANGLLATLPERRLQDMVDVPWFPKFRPTIHEILVQAATHSIHHRAQIATLVRQHGGDPKPTDFIVWVSKNRPAPQWTVSLTANS